MKPTLLILGMALTLSGCGGGGNSAPTSHGLPWTDLGPSDTGWTDINPSNNLIKQCETEGCTLDDAVTTTDFVVTNAPIILTTNASITLESN